MKLFLPVCLFVITPVLTSCDSKLPEKAEVIRPIPAMKVGESQKVSGRKFPGKAKATQEVNLAFDVGGGHRPLDRIQPYAGLYLHHQAQAPWRPAR